MGKLEKKLQQKWAKKIKKLKAAYKVAEASKDKKRKAYKAACMACIQKHKDKKKAWKKAAKQSDRDLKAYKKALKAWDKISKPRARQDNTSKGKPKEVLVVVERAKSVPSSPPPPPPVVKTRESLRKIEGIGPKIEELLHNAGILTFNQLSKARVEHLKQILSAAGPRYHMHNPGTWPKQSALAAKGRWEELKALQVELKGGKKV